MHTFLGQFKPFVDPDSSHGVVEGDMRHGLSVFWRTFALVIGGLFLFGCSDPDPPNVSNPTTAGDGLVDSEQPEDVALMSVPREVLAERVERGLREAQRQEATQAAVARLRELARIGRVLALREEDGEWLERARGWLREATRRRGLIGACEAGLEWAEMEARDAGDLREAYLIAYRTTRRFEGLPEQQACLARARRIRTVLAAFRPSPGVLAVVDADPHAEDPSVHRADDAPDPWAEWAAAAGVSGTPVVEAISMYGASANGDLEAAGASMRGVLALNQVTSFEGGDEAIDGRWRYYFDIPGARPSPEVPSQRQIGESGILAVGWERRTDATLRVFVDTSEEMRASRFALTDPYRLVLDLEPVRRAREANAENDVDLIVLDPGHGGLDYGARYEGMKESRLALDIAMRTREELQRRLPHAQIVMTRTRDVIVGLEERIAFANSINADLFVSIHLNAADEPVINGGVATFILDTENDAQATRLAARENGSTAEQVTGLQRILAGLHREEQVTASRLAAQLVQRETLVAGRRVIADLPDRGVKSAMFYVLVGARMPAILVEASFLTHPEEARHLRTERYRQTLAEGIASGITRYARR